MNNTITEIGIVLDYIIWSILRKYLSRDFNIENMNKAKREVVEMFMFALGLPIISEKSIKIRPTGDEKKFRYILSPCVFCPSGICPDFDNHDCEKERCINSESLWKYVNFEEQSTLIEWANAFRYGGVKE